MNPTNRKTITATAAGKGRSLEAQSFYLAAHRIDPDSISDEVDARFDAELAVETHAVTERLRKLEAQLDDVRRKLPEAEAVWERIRREVGDTVPSIAEALAMAVFALFTLALDAIFIAPSMDVLSVADAALQFVAASGLAVFSTLFFHIAGSVLLAGKANRWMKFAAAIAGVVGGLALTVWGMLRGYQLGFSAMLQANPLGQFLAAHRLLSSIFYTFITLATPLVGAAASIHAWRSLRVWREWRTAHDTYEGLHSTEAYLAKDIQLAKDEKAQIEAVSTARRKEWKAVAAQYYGRGASHGARQERLTAVSIKSLVIGLCIFGVLHVVPGVPLGSLLIVPLLAFGASFVFFNHRRVHPNHERYLRHENTQFAVPDIEGEEIERGPAQSLLTKGDE
jgi:hypothetical protein